MGESHTITTEISSLYEILVYSYFFGFTFKIVVIITSEKGIKPQG
jgi:hypothetical protein